MILLLLLSLYDRPYIIYATYMYTVEFCHCNISDALSLNELLAEIYIPT